jgi:hypothetical protein
MDGLSWVWNGWKVGQYRGGDWKGNERGVRSIFRTRSVGDWRAVERWVRNGSKRDNRYKNNLVSKQNVRDQYRKKRGGRSRERMVLEVRGGKESEVQRTE